jgi:predicted glycoside hydrolase/deacetylase ChbG (UPF0249 family)
MIIINADDWGRSSAETDAALFCFRAGRITSVSAMMFMEDSARAAGLALSEGMDVGLHLNFCQRFTGIDEGGPLRRDHDRIVRFATLGRYSRWVYNPALRKQFRAVYQAQVEEYLRLYGKPPSHIDGHRHLHLCMNMILDGILPENAKIRRNFFFWPGERDLMNRTCRKLLDRALSGRYRLTDYFFALSQCFEGDRMARVAELARVATVELMTHPGSASEYAYLMGGDHLKMLQTLDLGDFASL